MILKDLLKEPINNFYNENLKDFFTDNKVNNENFDELCKLTLVSPMNEITYRAKNSKEYSDFKKTIKIDNDTSYKNMLMYIYNDVKSYDKNVVFNLSQYLYCELYYNDSFYNPGRFVVDGGLPGRTPSTDNIDKLILLEDSILNGYRLKDEDKLCAHDILGISYGYGEWGNLDSAELLFKLIDDSMDYLEYHIVNKKIDDIYIPIKTTRSPGPFCGGKDSRFYNEDGFNMFQYNRYRMSVNNGLGKIYQLKGKYQESIDRYKNGINVLDTVLSHNRDIECLTESYKSSELMGDDVQSAEIYKSIRDTFTNRFSSDVWIKWIDGNIEQKNKQREVARETPMMALMIRYKIYKNLS